MLVVTVFVDVKPGSLDAFKKATIENSRNSLKEPGLARFDVLQQQDDPTKFALIEVYRTAEDPAKHKEAAHYKKWRETVEGMMATPRKSVKYDNVYPSDEGWE